MLDVARQSQPARMRCGKEYGYCIINRLGVSQPARMRCGKVLSPIAYSASVIVATRANALWQSKKDVHQQQLRVVATRTNALWQSRAIVVPEPETPKA